MCGSQGRSSRDVRITSLGCQCARARRRRALSPVACRWCCLWWCCVFSVSGLGTCGIVVCAACDVHPSTRIAAFLFHGTSRGAGVSVCSLNKSSNRIVIEADQVTRSTAVGIALIYMQHSSDNLYRYCTHFYLQLYLAVACSHRRAVFTQDLNLGKAVCRFVGRKTPFGFAAGGARRPHQTRDVTPLGCAFQCA